MAGVQLPARSSRARSTTFSNDTARRSVAWPAREIENLTDGRRDVVDVLDDDAQILGARAAAHLAQHLLGAAANHRQRAADLVRHLRRQHADRDQLLGAHQLVLQIARRRHGARIAQLVLEGQGAALLPQDEEPDARDRERRADRRDDHARQEPGLAIHDRARRGDPGDDPVSRRAFDRLRDLHGRDTADAEDRPRRARFCAAEGARAWKYFVTVSESVALIRPASRSWSRRRRPGR